MKGERRAMRQGDIGKEGDGEGERRKVVGGKVQYGGWEGALVRERIYAAIQSLFSEATRTRREG